MANNSDVRTALGRPSPQLDELIRRRREQVRNAGTIGGNIANGSPIGDLPPAPDRTSMRRWKAGANLQP